MNIYTTYFAKLRRLPEDVVPIAISLSVPTGYSGLRYHKLAPTWNILNRYKSNNDWTEYTISFNQILANLDAHTIVEQLAALSNGRDVALVCYEANDKPCHRHLVADWLNLAGYNVQEVAL